MDEHRRVQDRLYDAISDGDVESVKFCLHFGAKINVMGPSWRNIKTFPLHLAISCGNLEIIRLLVQNGAQTDEKDEKNQTPFDLALKNGYDDIVDYLKKTEDQEKARKNTFLEYLKNCEEEENKKAEENTRKKAEDEIMKKCVQDTEKVQENKKIVTEYAINIAGKKIKHVRTFEQITKKVPKPVAQRKALPKFGRSRNDGPGPHPTTTVVAEEIFMNFVHNKGEHEIDEGKSALDRKPAKEKARKKTDKNTKKKQDRLVKKAEIKVAEMEAKKKAEEDDEENAIAFILNPQKK